jgi:hypothetical protein
MPTPQPDLIDEAQLKYPMCFSHSTFRLFPPKFIAQPLKVSCVEMKMSSSELLDVEKIVSL